MSHVKVINPPHFTGSVSKKTFKVFLAGSINMGQSEDWQAKLIEDFNEMTNVGQVRDLQFLNPRRSDWNNDWKQEFEDPQFYQQVNWELTGIEQADLVLFYFAGEGVSPISLLELGLCLGRGQEVLVMINHNYTRKGNILITCERQEIGVIEVKDKPHAGDLLNKIQELRPTPTPVVVV